MLVDLCPAGAGYGELHGAPALGVVGNVHPQPETVSTQKTRLEALLKGTGIDCGVTPVSNAHVEMFVHRGVLRGVQYAVTIKIIRTAVRLPSPVPQHTRYVCPEQEEDDDGGHQSRVFQ